MNATLATATALGRPTSFTADCADAICARVMDGAILADICRDADMPDRRTVYRWFKAHDDFRLMYAHAREARADMIADEVINIADTEPDPNKARVRIDARKWYAAKLNPKRYGDRTVIAGDPDGALTETHLVVSWLNEIDGKSRGLPCMATGVEGEEL